MMELAEEISYTIDNTSLSIDYIGENDESGCRICGCCDGQCEEGEDYDD